MVFGFREQQGKVTGHGIFCCISSTLKLGFEVAAA